jgi:hypothetical protein
MRTRRAAAASAQVIPPAEFTAVEATTAHGPPARYVIQILYTNHQLKHGLLDTLLHLLSVDLQPLNTRGPQPICNQLCLQPKVYSHGLPLRLLPLKLVLLGLQPMLQPVDHSLPLRLLLLKLVLLGLQPMLLPVDHSLPCRLLLLKLVLLGLQPMLLAVDLQPKVYSHGLSLRLLLLKLILLDLQPMLLPVDLQILFLQLIQPLNTRGLWLLVIEIYLLQLALLSIDLGYSPHLWVIISQVRLLVLFSTHFR